MEQNNRWRQRFEDYENALARLTEVLGKKHFEELEKDGVIQRFEFTFELAWKTLKDYLEDQGILDVSTPKKVLRKAFQANLFEDDQIWLAMQEDRNLLSHVYKQSTSDRIFLCIINVYIKVLQDLAEVLKKEL